MTVYISNSAVTRNDTSKIGKLFLSGPVALSLFWRYSNKVTIYASFQALGLLQLVEIFQACVKHFKEFPFAKFVLFEVCLSQFVRNVHTQRPRLRPRKHNVRKEIFPTKVRHKSWRSDRRRCQ